MSIVTVEHYGDVMQGVYLILNTTNQRCYVGSAVDIKRRWSWHVSRLNNGKHNNVHLQRAWMKYGPECFEYKICELVNDETQLLVREELIIQSIPPHQRYNICEEAGRGPNMRGWKHTDLARENMAAAQRGRKHTAETRAKISAAWRPRHTPESLEKAASKIRGRKLTPEHRAKVVAALKGVWLGRKHTKETKDKLAASHLGRKHTENAKMKMRGRKHTESAKAKIRAAHLGIPKSPEHIAKIALAKIRNRGLSRINQQETMF